MSSLIEHCHGEKTHFSGNEERTFSLSQMNKVELVQTLPWRENALFEERGKNPMSRRLAQFVKLLLGIRSCLVRNL